MCIRDSIGEAHSEGFLNNRQKINEKLGLFRNVRELVYCIDYPELNELVVHYKSNVRNHGGENPLRLFTWSQKNEEADLYIQEVKTDSGKTNITAVYKSETLSIAIPFHDAASVENAIHCWSVLLLMGVKPVSYTHLDVYKRQGLDGSGTPRPRMFMISASLKFK